MKKIAIVHYMPLEFYPPITNFLDVLSEQEMVTKVWSTKNHKNRPNYENVKLTEIVRTSFPKATDFKLLRLFKYIWFNVVCFIGLLLYRPKVILYYESYSAYPVYLYYRLFGKKAKYFIHYHEYESPSAYNQGMKIVKFYHQLEKKYLYKHAFWISQTNSDRVKLFKKDHPNIDDSTLHTLANYPPQDWQPQKGQQRSTSDKVRLLYIGALSFENTYIKALVDFVKAHQKLINLTIYSYNTSANVSTFLEQQDQQVVRYFKKGIDYHDIPKIAASYDVGLVLYNGHNLNYVYNAPNKLFEYLACGINVWVPKALKGCEPYLNKDSRPTVTAVDFDGLEVSLIEDYFKTLNLPRVKVSYTCDNELQTLIEKIKA